jgi:hypothetical protein
MQKDLAEIQNLSRFRPPLRTEGTRETPSRSGTASKEVVGNDLNLIGFLVSTEKVLLQCWSCLNGGGTMKLIAAKVICGVKPVGFSQEGRGKIELCAADRWKLIRRYVETIIGFILVVFYYCQFGNRKFTSHIYL